MKRKLEILDVSWGMARLHPDGASVGVIKSNDVAHPELLVGTESWQLSATAGKGPKFYSLVAKDFGATSYKIFPSGNVEPDVTFVAGKGSAQNNDNPKARFGSHVVVMIGNDIYDPSYGQPFTGANALLDLQTKEIFGFSISGPLENAVPLKNLKKGQPVMETVLANPKVLNLNIVKVTPEAVVLDPKLQIIGFVP